MPPPHSTRVMPPNHGLLVPSYSISSHCAPHHPTLHAHIVRSTHCRDIHACRLLKIQNVFSSIAPSLQYACHPTPCHPLFLFRLRCLIYASPRPRTDPPAPPRLRVLFSSYVRCGPGLPRKITPLPLPSFLRSAPSLTPSRPPSPLPRPCSPPRAPPPPVCPPLSASSPVSGAPRSSPPPCDSPPST